ncbi:MAG: type II toxin-antitoxin system RelE/ParE family toxin [Rhodospirillales bacterium]
MPRAVRIELAAMAGLLKEFGPELKRPHADTLNGSRHANMKELRFKADDGVWRAAYAFDPKRNAVILTAGDKSGTSEKRFYKRLIAKADRRFDKHLAVIGGKGGL